MNDIPLSNCIAIYILFPMGMSLFFYFHYKDFEMLLSIRDGHKVIGFENLKKRCTMLIYFHAISPKVARKELHIY